MSTDDNIQLDVIKREVTGKKVAKLRKEGQVPAVIYGADLAPVNIQAPINAIKKTVVKAGTHTPVDVMIDSKPQTAIIKTVDINPATNTIQHVAFQAVSRDQIVTTEVPVVIIGEDESDAKKAGLVIMQSVERLEVKAKPADLPKSLEISAADLKENGDKLTLADIVLPVGVELTEDELTLTIATVYDPAVLAAANEAADKAADEAKAAEAAKAAAEGAEGETPATTEGEATTTTTTTTTDGEAPTEEINA